MNFLIPKQDLVLYISSMTDYIWLNLFFYFRNSNRNTILQEILLVYIWKEEEKQ